ARARNAGRARSVVQTGPSPSLADARPLATTSQTQAYSRQASRGHNPVGRARPAYSGSGSDRPSGHSKNVERRIQLFLGEGAVGDVAVLDDHLTDGLTLLESLLRDRGGILVAEVAVQRRDDRR